MSIAIRRLSAAFVVLAVGLMTLPSALQAQSRPDDSLERVKQLNRIAAQKFDADLRQGVADYEKLLPKDPAGAAAILKGLLPKVQNDTLLDEGRRKGWKDALNGRIRIAEAKLDEKVTRDLERMQKRLIGSGRAAEFERMMAEQDKINQSFNSIRNLRAQGHGDEANRLAGDLATRYPNSPAVLAARRSTSMAQAVADNRNLLSERERRVLGVFGQVDRSSLPPLGDVEFPADWKEKTAKRSTAQKMTEKEKHILQALNTPVDGAFDGQGFEDVMDWLQKRFKVPMLLDRRALDELMIDYKTPIKYNPRGATLRTVLRRILSDLGLAYIVKEEAIQVTSALKARESMTTRAYYVGDLVNGLNLQMGPYGNPFQVLQSAAQMIDLIQSTVQTDSWQINGGPATIRFDPVTMSLLVKQTAEIHFILGGGLGK